MPLTAGRGNAFRASGTALAAEFLRWKLISVHSGSGGFTLEGGFTSGIGNRKFMNPLVNPAVLFGQLIGYGLSSTLAVVLALLAWQAPYSVRRAQAMNSSCAAIWS